MSNTFLEPVINMMSLATTMVFDRFPLEVECRSNYFILYQVCEAVANELAENILSYLLLHFLNNLLAWKTFTSMIILVRLLNIKKKILK